MPAQTGNGYRDEYRAYCVVAALLLEQCVYLGRRHSRKLRGGTVSGTGLHDRRICGGFQRYVRHQFYIRSGLDVRTRYFGDYIWELSKGGADYSKL